MSSRMPTKFSSFAKEIASSKWPGWSIVSTQSTSSGWPAVRTNGVSVRAMPPHGGVFRMVVVRGGGETRRAWPKASAGTSSTVASARRIDVPDTWSG